MEFRNADDAAYAMAAMNGHPFDAKHTFRINRFIDVEKYTNMDETWTAPEPEPYKPKVGQPSLPSLILC
jgi:translation initiation factor 3 subunit B